MKNKLTTLCYIEQDDCYLMLLRNRKQNDLNEGKWIGVGGHFEDGESPEDCLLREAKEETGLTLLDYKLRGVVTFVSDVWESEYMYLFTASKFQGQLTSCDEGELSWIPKEEIFDLNLWEGDYLFLNKMYNDNNYFEMELIYINDKLVSYNIKEE